MVIDSTSAQSLEKQRGYTTTSSKLLNFGSQQSSEDGVRHILGSSTNESYLIPSPTPSSKFFGA